jgi:CRP/FNR family transcriptional regulator, cyclic AMP receptor protein
MKKTLTVRDYPNAAAKQAMRVNPLEGMINRPLSVKICSKGECIYTQGRRAECLYIVRDGMVLLSRLSIDGRETVLAVLGPGEHFGEVNLLLDDSLPFNSVALVRTELLVIPKSVFQELMLKPEACKYLMTSLAGRCSDSWTQIEALACNLVAEKIRIALSWLCTRIGVLTSNGIRIDISQTRLAQMVGTTRESLNRKLRSLKRMGIIETRNRPGNKSSFLVRLPEFLSEAGGRLESGQNHPQVSQDRQALRAQFRSVVG